MAFRFCLVKWLFSSRGTSEVGKVIFLLSQGATEFVLLV